jgi:hypothetical protein
MWERLKLTGLVIKVFAEVYFKIWSPVVLWLAIAWYFDISFVTALLVFIAVSITGLGQAFQTYQTQVKDAPHPVAKRDFYVVIDTNYKWNPLTNPSRPNLKPDTLDSIYAFESFEAAKSKFDAVSSEHYPFEDRSPWLEYPESYMDGSGYTEYEARLWVIPASSKQEAHDEACYHDRRRLLPFGSGAFASHLVFITNSDRRRDEYRTWWRRRMDYQRYLDSRATYLKEHPATTPECAEPLDIEQWAAHGDETWRERAFPGHPSKAH